MKLGNPESKQPHKSEIELKDCEACIKKIEQIATPFLEKEVLESLHAIESQEQAAKSETREKAKKALGGIMGQLKILAKETNVTQEKYQAVKEKYKIISQAVGMINNGLVDHAREVSLLLEHDKIFF